MSHTLHSHATPHDPFAAVSVAAAQSSRRTPRRSPRSDGHGGTRVGLLLALAAGVAVAYALNSLAHAVGECMANGFSFAKPSRAAVAGAHVKTAHERFGLLVYRAGIQELVEREAPVGLTRHADALAAVLLARVTAELAGAESRVGKQAAAAAAAALAAAAPALRFSDDASPLPPPTPVTQTPSPDVHSAPHLRTLRDGRVVDGRLTHQTCAIAADESELCRYEGVLCYDGTGMVVVVPDATAWIPEAQRGDASARVGDPSSSCMDFRYSEPASFADVKCRYETTGTRGGGTAGDRREGAGTTAGVSPHATGLDLSVRGWGPANRHSSSVRMVSPDHVFASPDDADAGVEAHEPVVAHPQLPYLRVRRRTARAPGHTVDWLEGGGLWLAVLPGQANFNPYMMASSAAMPLFAMLSGNATGRRGGAAPSTPAAGAPPDLPRSTHRHVSHSPWGAGSQPPLGAVVFMGPGVNEIDTPTEMSLWFRGVLGNITLGQTGDADGAPPSRPPVLFRNGAAAYNGRHMLCARDGWVPSFQPKLFADAATASAFRRAAYATFNLPALGLYPEPLTLPRRITVLDRRYLGGRAWFHASDVEAAARAFPGWTVEYIGRMDFLTMAQQVQAMARSGIVVAPHGAHLTNMAFMPAGAHVLEVVPPGQKTITYASLAGRCGLGYRVLQTRATMPAEFTHLWAGRIANDPALRAECIVHNVTGFDVQLRSMCQRLSKATPLIVPVPVLRRMLADAVASITAAEAAAAAAEAPTGRGDAAPQAAAAAAAEAASSPAPSNGDPLRQLAAQDPDLDAAGDTDGLAAAWAQYEAWAADASAQAAAAP